MKTRASAGFVATTLRRGVEVYQVPAYANVGGTGDRRASIAVTTNISTGGGAINLVVDGNNSTNVMYLSGPFTVAGKFIKFDFGAKKSVTEIKLYMSNNSTDTTVWKFKASNNNDIATAVDVSVNQGIAGQALTPRTMTINAVGYRYIWLLGVSGDTPAAVFCREFEFRIGSLP